LAAAWPATALLVLLSLALTWLFGIAIGTWQANSRSRTADAAFTVATVSLNAMPGYWLGLVLVMVFTYRLRLLPAFGAAGLDADFLGAAAQAADRLRHLALPLLTLTLIGIGGAARFVRAAMREVRDAPFLVVARAKGLDGTQVVIRHQLRNALVPIVTLLGLSFPALFSGTVFVEAIFAWPGVGQLMVQGVQARDYPVVMAAATVSAVLVVAGNLLADALSGVVDPRMRGARDGA
ncbi:MAG: ABC transporter permease, partial [Gemmatimonadota bacterium]